MKHTFKLRGWNVGALFENSSQYFLLLNWNLKNENSFPPQNLFERSAFRKQVCRRNCSLIPHFSNLKTLNRKIERQKRIKRIIIFWNALNLIISRLLDIHVYRYILRLFDPNFHFKALNCFVKIAFIKIKRFPHWRDVGTWKRQSLFWK